MQQLVVLHVEGRDYVSELSPTDPVFIPQIIHEYGERRRNEIDRQIGKIRK
jgi:hypothetical protein